tara:strand:- start:12527 stop:12859 length:333 start_codon:yes stop_codon:yes gene_type:complete
MLTRLQREKAIELSTKLVEVLYKEKEYDLSRMVYANAFEVYAYEQYMSSALGALKRQKTAQVGDHIMNYDLETHIEYKGNKKTLSELFLLKAMGSNYIPVSIAKIILTKF